MALKKVDDLETQKSNKKFNRERITSDIPGLYGLIETFLRRFRTLSFGILLSPVILICTFSLGLATVPGIYLFTTVNSFTSAWPEVFHYVALGLSLSMGYFLFGVSLIFIAPTMNFLMPFRVKPWRGIWFSLPAIPWYVHNALTYIVRYSFLEFVTPTPLNILFYRMMGMKIGKGVVINTTNISDPALITLEDYVTIGGSAHIFAHYGQKGVLIISPVVIKKGANIGLKASIMGGVTIGEKALVKPHTVILPKQTVKDGEII